MGEYDYLISMRVIGVPQSGKTSFIERFCRNHFSTSYLPGPFFSFKDIDIDGKTIRIQLMDQPPMTDFEMHIGTASNEESTLKRAQIVFVTVDLSNADALNSTKKFLENMSQHFIFKPMIVLVPTKNDVESRLTELEIQEFALARNMRLCPGTSAKTDKNIMETITWVSREYLLKHRTQRLEEISVENRLSAFIHAYQNRYQSEFFKNPFSRMRRKINARDITTFEQVEQYAKDNPNSRTAKVLNEQNFISTYK